MAEKVLIKKNKGGRKSGSGNHIYEVTKADKTKKTCKNMSEVSIFLGISKATVSRLLNGRIYFTNSRSDHLKDIIIERKPRRNNNLLHFNTNYKKVEEINIDNYFKLIEKGIPFIKEKIDLAKSIHECAKRSMVNNNGHAALKKKLFIRELKKEKIYDSVKDKDDKYFCDILYDLFNCIM